MAASLETGTSFDEPLPDASDPSDLLSLSSLGKRLRRQSFTAYWIGKTSKLLEPLLVRLQEHVFTPASSMTKGTVSQGVEEVVMLRRILSLQFRGEEPAQVSNDHDESARDLAKKLYDEIMPQHGKFHSVEEYNAPKRGLPAGTEISGDEYIEMVTPLFKYLDQKTQKALIFKVLETTDATVRAKSAAHLLTSKDALEPKHVRALASIITSNADFPRQTAQRGTIVGVNRLREEQSSLATYQHTYRVGDLTSDQIVRKMGAIAARLDDAVDYDVRNSNTRNEGTTNTTFPSSEAQLVRPQRLRQVQEPPTPPAYTPVRLPRYSSRNNDGENIGDPPPPYAQRENPDGRLDPVNEQARRTSNTAILDRRERTSDSRSV